jgi:3-oxoacyl-[acyl-carrier protein] reductase
MAIELNGLVCLITGADEGIGNGVVKGFLQRGAKVAAGLYDAAKSASRVAPALALQMDVTKADQVRAAVAKTVETFGRVDVLVNNAGIYPTKPADDLTFEEWRSVLDVNLDGTFRCCEAVIPHMKAQRSGVIINVGSITVRGGAPGLAHYVPSKAAIIGLTRAFARDLGKHGIRVNCIHPGAIQTEGEARKFSDPEVLLKILNEKQCLPGRITPADIEPTFAFLASAESAPITGQCLTVDKGWMHE